MDAALETIKLRLANQNISDSETYLDYKSNRIIVRFPGRQAKRTSIRKLRSRSWAKPPS